MDPFGELGVDLGGNCDCRCGFLYVPVLGRGWILRDCQNLMMAAIGRNM